MEKTTTSRVPIPGAILAGLASGSVFIAAEMLMNVMLGEPFLGPLRMISSIPLGEQALSPSYSLGIACSVGLVLNLVLSALFGVIFVIVMRVLHIASWGKLIAFGAGYGALLWLMNFYVIALVMFPQFLNVNPLWNGFVAHTCFFGAPLGWYTAAAKLHNGAAAERPAERQRRYG